MEENTNDVIYSNGIIILNLRLEVDVAPMLSIKAGELFELAKHNIILLRAELQEDLTVQHLCSALQIFGFIEGEKNYIFQFSKGIGFGAETADDYPTMG